MRRILRIFCLALCCLIFAFQAQATDYYVDANNVNANKLVGGSPWPMFRGNAQHTGQSPYVGAQTDSLKWKYQTGDYVDSSPAVGSDGTIYVGSGDGYVYALNPDSSLKWKYQTEGYWVSSSPALGSDGTIYVGSQDNHVYALNPDGSLKWRYQTGYWVDSSPAVGSDGTIYVGSGDGYVYALNPDSSLKWKYQTEGYWVSSSPALGSDGTIYVGSQDNHVYALNPDGSLKWRYQTGYWVDSSPAVGSDGTIYVGSGDDYLYALNPDGSLKWDYQTGGKVWSSPALGSDGTIYVGSYDSYLYALNPDGSLKWKYQTEDLVYSSPALGSDGTIYVGSYDSYLYALNPDGSLKWRYQTGDHVWSSPALGSDGTIYLGSVDGYVYAFAFIEGFPPMISSLTPSSGSTSGGTSVTIDGSNFGSSRGSGGVTFGGSEATSYTSWSDNQIECVTPAHAAGAVDVVVTMDDRLSGTKISGFTYISSQDQTTEHYVDADNGNNDTGDGTQGNPWKTISYALAQVSGTGHTIHVAAGTYGTDMGGVWGEMFPITLKNGVSIEGEDKTTTIVDAELANPVFTGDGISDQTTISNLTIKNGNGSDGGGISLKSSNPIIRDNIIRGNKSFYGGAGIKIEGGSPQILNNIFENNTCSSYGGIVDIEGQSSPVIDGNVFLNNKGGMTNYSGGAIVLNELIHEGSPVISHNIISQTDGHGISILYHSYDGFIMNNTIIGNSSGIHLEYGAKGRIKNNVIAENGYGIREKNWSIYDSDPSLVEYNLFFNNSSGHYLDEDQSAYTNVTLMNAYIPECSNNLEGDPLFVNSANHDYHLQESSPAIDAGDPEDDCSQEPPPNGERINIGAYGNTLEATISSRPSITTIFPSSVPSSGGTEVTINGYNFGNTRGTGRVTFGGLEATSYTSWSDNQVVCVTPLHAAGVVDVVVIADNGLSGTKVSAFTYISPPTISSLTPSSGSTSGGTSVTISGSNFGSSRGSGIVTFGGVEASSYTSWSNDQIVCITPAHAAGAVDVVVTTDNGLSKKELQGYTYGEVVTSPWPMFRGNAQHTAQSLYLGAQTNFRKWTYKAESWVNSSPSVGSDGTIYVGSGDGYVYVLYPDSSLKWKYQTEGGVYSSPSVGPDGTIYVGSSDGYVYALYPDSSLKWKYQTGRYVYSSPSVGSDGTIYVGSWDSYIYVLNPDGSLKWRYQTGDRVQSSPAIGSDGTIYVGSTDNYLYAFNPDGSLKWKYQTEGDVYSSPALGSDGTIYVGSYDNYIYALNSDGSLKWKYQTGNWVESSPAVGSDGTIYVGSYDNYIYALNPDGSLKWKYQTWGGVDSSPAVGSDGTVYVGSWDDYIYALNADGSLKWKYQTGSGVVSSPAIGSDGTVYVGSNDGYIYAFALIEAFPPTISSLTPSSGSTLGGTSVTISGSNFGSSPGSVMFGDSVAASYTSWSDNEIVCLTPEYTQEGVVDVVVTTSSGISDTTKFTYVSPPVILSISVSSDTVFTIKGNRFGAVHGSGSVKFGDLVATSYTNWSDNEIACVASSHLSGAVDIVVISDNGLESLPYTVVFPTISSLSPVSGSTWGGTTVTLTGTGFGAVRGRGSVTFGDSVATSFESWSDNAIVCITPSHVAGIVDVVVTTDNGLSGTKASVFTYVTPPAVSTLSPSSGPTSGGTSVTITGSDFGGAQGTGSVVFGEVEAISYTSWSDNQIVCVTPAHTEGVVNVVVKADNGLSGTKVSAFNYISPPEISTLTPSSGSTSGSATVTISGSNFGSSRGSGIVSFGGVEASSYTSWSDDQIVCVTPGHAAGAVDVVVTADNALSGTKVGGYTYVPLVVSLWPMFGGNAQHTGQSPYIGAQTDSLKWRYEIGNLVSSSPAIGSDGTIYVGSRDNYIYALNADGSLKWKYQTGNWVESSPAIGSDGTIYVGSYDNHVYALNADGSLKWEYQTANSVRSSPSVGSDGTIYVGSYDNYIYALNVDGSLKWKHQTGDQVPSSPAIGSDGTIYVGSFDDYVYALNPDGSLKWKYLSRPV